MYTIRTADTVSGHHVVTLNTARADSTFFRNQHQQESSNSTPVRSKRPYEYSLVILFPHGGSTPVLPTVCTSPNQKQTYGMNNNNILLRLTLGRTRREKWIKKSRSAARAALNPASTWYVVGHAQCFSKNGITKGFQGLLVL